MTRWTTWLGLEVKLTNSTTEAEYSKLTSSARFSVDNFCLVHLQTPPQSTVAIKILNLSSPHLSWPLLPSPLLSFVLFSVILHLSFPPLGGVGGRFSQFNCVRYILKVFVPCFWVSCRCGRQCTVVQNRVCHFSRGDPDGFALNSDLQTVECLVDHLSPYMDYILYKGTGHLIQGTVCTTADYLILLYSYRRS